MYFVSAVPYANHDLTEDMTVFSQSALGLQARFKLQVESVGILDDLSSETVVGRKRDAAVPTTDFSITPNWLNSSINIRASAGVR